MLDVGRGPLLVGVADRPAAVVHCAELPPEERLFDLVEARVDLFAEQSLDGCAHACAKLEASGTPVIVTIRTTAQALLGAITASQVALDELDWQLVGLTVGTACLLSVLMAIVASGIGEPGTASVLNPAPPDTLKNPPVP